MPLTPGQGIFVAMSLRTFGAICTNLPVLLLIIVRFKYLNMVSVKCSPGELCG